MSDFVSKLELSPKLLTPWIKPDGQLKLNKSYPYANNVISANLFKTAPQDHAFFNVSGTTGALTYDYQGVLFPGTAGNKISLDKKLALPTNEITIILRFTRVNGGQNGGVFSDKNQPNWASAVGLSFNIRTDDGWLLKIGTDETYKNTSTFTAGNTYDVIVRWKGGSFTEVYIDKVESAYTSKSTAASYSASAINPRIGAYYDETAGFVSDDLYHHLIVLDKAIPLTDAFSLSDKPYSVVDTVGSIALPIPAAVGGVTIMNQIQKSNLGADLFNGTLI